MALIHEQLSKIMAEIGAIGKDRKNSQQGYNFRGIDDVYFSSQRVFALHGVITLPEVLEDRTEERTTKTGGALIYRVLRVNYHFFANDGTSITATVIGEGMDSGDKASNKAMAAAHKYAILQVLMIPTEEAKDPENESHEVKPKITDLLEEISLCMDAESLKETWTKADKLYPNLPANANERKRIKESFHKMKEKLGVV